MMFETQRNSICISDGIDDDINYCFVNYPNFMSFVKKIMDLYMGDYDLIFSDDDVFNVDNLHERLRSIKDEVRPGFYNITMDFTPHATCVPMKVYNTDIYCAFTSASMKALLNYNDDKMLSIMTNVLPTSSVKFYTYSHEDECLHPYNPLRKIEIFRHERTEQFARIYVHRYNYVHKNYETIEYPLVYFSGNYHLIV